MPVHYPCRVRTSTACWGYGPCTTLRPYRAGTDTKPTVSFCVRVVFFSAVFRAAHMTRPIWTSIRRLTVTGLIAVLTAKACSTSIVVAQPDVNQSIREMSK